MSVSQQKHPAFEAPAGSMPPAGAVRIAESLVLLAHDESLIEALISVVPAACLTLVSDEAALANQVLSGQAGVVFIDAGAPHLPPGATAQLAQRLHQQLPDVVLVVAGDGAAQSELAALVADGTIYRFVHKPVSAQRVKLFVDAAWRKRDGASASGVFPALSMPQLPPTATPQRVFPWPFVAAAVLFAGGAAGWFLLHSNSPAVTAVPPQTALPGATRAARPASVPAMASAVTMTAPAPGSAAPATPADLDRLATAAEQALLAGDLTEAARLTDAARAVAPNHVRVKFLTAQIAREQARAAAHRRAVALAAVQTPVRTAAPGSAPAMAANAVQLPVVAASATTTTEAMVASSPALLSAPSSTPPVSEARDRNSVAAVILKRIYSVDPVFPEVAREHDLAGFVDLEFTVRADGSVTEVTVLKAQPAGVFEKSAVTAVSQWRYRPIERNGLPVNEHARLRLNFAYK